MSKLTSFAVVRTEENGYDYVIGGMPLLARLETHERLSIDHVCALGVVDGARDRLLLAEEPDLVDGFTALYVCGMCGGYDGNPIGARVRRDGEQAVWEAMGYHYDFDGEPAKLFARVTSFQFSWREYEQALRSV